MSEVSRERIKMKKKTLFRIAIQEFIDGKPKKFSNVTVKEGDSLKDIHKKIDEKIVGHIFKEGEQSCVA